MLVVSTYNLVAEKSRFVAKASNVQSVQTAQSGSTTSQYYCTFKNNTKNAIELIFGGSIPSVKVPAKGSRAVNITGWEDVRPTVKDIKNPTYATAFTTIYDQNKNLRADISLRVVGEKCVCPPASKVCDEGMCSEMVGVEKTHYKIIVDSKS